MAFQESRTKTRFCWIHHRLAAGSQNQLTRQPAGNSGFTAGRGFNPAGGAPGGDLEYTKVYVRCDSGYDGYHETHLIVTQTLTLSTKPPPPLLFDLTPRRRRRSPDLFRLVFRGESIGDKILQPSSAG
ncbi:hypothetical protein F511_22233 [Dorcoceras hygrometricum]|uniref:Uncharacterized protein n=1 Tax=Dorcoceras hygrometricum TaxID=472368 RepID=A0A2Z7CLN9_9LAMI|nr:hypothetical protein F511_22233 [Dorcoceras hygrometricum]